MSEKVGKIPTKKLAFPTKCECRLNGRKSRKISTKRLDAAYKRSKNKIHRQAQNKEIH